MYIANTQNNLKIVIISEGFFADEFEINELPIIGWENKNNYMTPITYVPIKQRYVIKNCDNNSYDAYEKDAKIIRKLSFNDAINYLKFNETQEIIKSTNNEIIYKKIKDVKWLSKYFDMSDSHIMRVISNYMVKLSKEENYKVIALEENNRKNRIFDNRIIELLKNNLKNDEHGSILTNYRQDLDPHLGCYSYPDCDLNPNGCKILMGKDAEPFGHK